MWRLVLLLALAILGAVPASAQWCVSPIHVISWARPPGEPGYLQFTGTATYTPVTTSYADYHGRMVSADGRWIAYGFIKFSQQSCPYLSRTAYYTIPQADIYQFVPVEQGGGCDTRLVEDGYDPYAKGSDDPWCSGGGGGGGIDWNTGEGSPGSCPDGEEAMVEYICVDVWNGTAWIQHSCGWASVCT